MDGGGTVSTITITHTHADGTLIEGSAKGDGVYEILRGCHAHWRWFRSLGCLGLMQSRDKPAKTWLINQAAKALREAGHEVTVDIDESRRRDVATVEADRAERAGARTERLSERSERRGTEANAAYARAHQMAEAIPFGQPILVGHHSEGRDRNYRAKIERTFGRAFEGMAEAERLQGRAEAAEANQAHRESIPATLRRIERLEAEERGVKRDLTGRMGWIPDGEGGHKYALMRPEGSYRERLEVRATDLGEQLTYWHDQVKAAEESGVKVWSRADFAKGDYVEFGRRWYEAGRWYQIERVNPKSLSVPHGTNDGELQVITRDQVRHAMGPSQWTRKVTYDEVTGRRSAAEMAEALASAGEVKAS
jgi:Domain of unknown function (DUF3560)